MSEATQSVGANLNSTFAPSIARSFGVSASVLDAVLIVVCAVATGSGYFNWVLGKSVSLEIYAVAGALMALIYTSLRASKKGYDPRRTYAGDLQFADMFSAWTLSLVGLLLACFLTKSTATYSRGSMLIFYVFGFGCLMLVRLGTAKLMRWGVREGVLSLGRVMLVGTDQRIISFKERHNRYFSGLNIEGVYVLPTAEAALADGVDRAKLEESILKDAVDAARRANIDDVFILVPWSDEGQVARCGAAFMTLPARVHLGPEPVLDRFSALEVECNGGVSTLSVARGPLQLAEVISKRLLDIVVASVALVLLAPVLIATAIAIRWDSAGPILFRQRRNGFNQDTFEILKFRSMTVTESGETATQATRNDKRVTRVGRFLRKSSIDELPQLLNVLMGTMSIVGPRPHPTNLDKAYESKIALYARRHNVKPGITGWAQVNGFRGETDTDDKMRSRIDYDLYYIENWSLGFDIYIMMRTVLSPRVFANAY